MQVNESRYWKKHVLLIIIDNYTRFDHNLDYF